MSSTGLSDGTAPEGLSTDEKDAVAEIPRKPAKRSTPFTCAKNRGEWGMKIDQRLWSVGDLVKCQSEINLNPIWQRGPAWRAARQVLLIDCNCLGEVIGSRPKRTNSSPNPIGLSRSWGCNVALDDRVDGAPNVFV
jgi:hypothetical protein